MENSFSIIDVNVDVETKVEDICCTSDGSIQTALVQSDSLDRNSVDVCVNTNSLELFNENTEPEINLNLKIYVNYENTEHNCESDDSTAINPMGVDWITKKPELIAQSDLEFNCNVNNYLRGCLWLVI